MFDFFRTQSSGVKSSNKDKDKDKDKEGGILSLSFPSRGRNSKALAEPTITTSYRVFVKIVLIGKGSERGTTFLNGITHRERIVPLVDGEINLTDIVNVEIADSASRVSQDLVSSESFHSADVWQNSSVRKIKDWKNLFSNYIPLVHFGFADMTFHRRDRQSPSSEDWKQNGTRQSFRMDLTSYQSRSVTTTPTKELKAFLDSRLDADKANRDADQASQANGDEWDDSEAFSSSDRTSAVDSLTTSGSNTQPIWSDKKKTLARSVSITALSADHKETSQDVAEIQRGHGKITVVYSPQWGEVKPTIIDEVSAR